MWKIESQAPVATWKHRVGVKKRFRTQSAEGPAGAEGVTLLKRWMAPVRYPKYSSKPRCLGSMPMS